MSWDRDDVHVLQPRRRSGLVEEPLLGSLLVEKSGRHHLDRDLAAEQGVAAAIEHAEAALVDAFEQRSAGGKANRRQFRLGGESHLSHRLIVHIAENQRIGLLPQQPARLPRSGDERHEGWSVHMNRGVRELGRGTHRLEN